jgi:isopropylmalate/homocitrate/citramalate synthase
MDDSQLFEWVKFDPKGKWWVSHWNLLPEVVEELNLPSKVTIKDTTLREGEETPNVSMTLEDKLAIARMLSEMGIQEADVGYVGVVGRDRAFAKKVKSEGLRLKLAAHSYALSPNFKQEIDRICEAEVEIVQIVLYPVPGEHYKRKEYSLRLAEAVHYARDRGLFVVFLPTLTNWELDFCQELLQAAVDEGVNRICPAGIGCLHVTAYKNLVKWIKKLFPGVQVGVHVHNDYGLATACSLASVEAGAEVVDTAVNGMSDRSGISAFEEMVMALTILYGMDLGIRLDRITELSRMVQKISGVSLQPYKPIVGETIFIQNTDSHIVSEIKGKWSIMNSFAPSSVGGKGKIVFGPHSLGGQGLRAKIEAMGLNATEGQIIDLLGDMENLLKIQKAINEEEVEQMVRKKIQSM